ncbi:DUF6114 domain-containing protein [Streptomyces sp. NPDC093595]|uniref:DUF6114 domain-containing protein n=1 Tax=Streptomyces sp. NPDC093595 TaxID=3366045 RepID=UPI0038180FFA
MSAESTGSRGFTYWRLRFRAWRGNRPFWAGLFTLLGSVPIAYLPYADVRLGNITIAMATTAGAGSLIIGLLLATLGLTMWFHSIVRVFAGVAAIILGLVSLPISNIGGFLVGFLCSLIGGALSISWAPGVPRDEAGEDESEGAAPVSEDATAAAVPGQRPEGGTDLHVTEATTQANGGRNSAG